MFARASRRRQKNDDTRTYSRNDQQAETVEHGVNKPEVTGNPSSTSQLQRVVPHGKEAKNIKIDCRAAMCSVVVLADGEHIVSGGQEGKVQKWRIRDGIKVGTPMDAGSDITDVAVSRDGQWIVSGTVNGTVTVWNTTNGTRVIGFKRHSKQVTAVDIAFDGTKIVTGSDDETVCVWSCSTGKRLLQLKHDDQVVGATFSPDGCWLATATWHHPIRVYNSLNGDLVFIPPITVNTSYNRSLAWSDANQLFAISDYGTIHCLDPSNQTALSKWPIHSGDNPKCIALARSGALIAASAGSSVSFWSTATRKQIGSVMQYDHPIRSMALSDTDDLVVCGNNSLTFTVLSFGPLSTTLHKTVQTLRNELTESQRTAKQQKDSLCALIRSLGAIPCETIPDEQGTSHNENAEQHHPRLPDTQNMVNQEEDSFDECVNSLRARDEYSSRRIASLEQTIQDLHVQLETCESKIASLEHTNQDLRVQLARAQEKADLSIRINCAHEQRLECEFLYSQGRIYDAACSLLKLENTLSDDVRADMSVIDWLQEFAHRCATALDRLGDEASDANKQDEAVSTYSVALLLRFSTPVLTKWARKMLVRGTGKEVLSAASKFKAPRLIVYYTICGILEDDGRLTEAVECFRRAQDEFIDDATHNERTQWEHDFCVGLAEKLEKLGDIARDAKKHDEAIRRYSIALKLNPTNFNDVLLKKSNEVIELDPSSYIGYEGKHAALHGMTHYSEAYEAFRIMLSKLEQSPDPALRELRYGYVDATHEIQNVVEQTICHLPRVLIDTDTGLLHDKVQQAAAFEQLAVYDELRSSMTRTTQLDRERIREEVKNFYRYIMFSHKWQPHEPTFQAVEKNSIYDLPSSPAFEKLQSFCKVVQALHFKWAWSDTCCVNQLDKGVVQESLVAMFKWYRGSSLTVVHLLGVFSESQEIGCLLRSIWNTRGWTYQEYLASEVVQFYTEDWKPYLGLEMFNHKESPVILSEMERAMNFAKEELETLRPGLDRAREKLYLASRRQTTREEDMAYSLFGIFNVALPIIYGEGNQAVGRLLEHILTRSDNVTLLAWTGNRGSHHSYLPAELTVYDKIAPLHIPMSAKSTEMDDLVTELRSSLPDVSLITMLYRQLWDLPTLTLVSGRLRLPGIIFPLANLVHFSESDPPVYRGTSPMLGDVEIMTGDDISGVKGALLVHPWIGPLIDEDFVHGEPLFDETTRGLRLVVRLKQPFGALLLAPVTRTQYKRVATDSLIMARIREERSLEELMDSIRTVDVQ